MTARLFHFVFPASAIRVFAIPDDSPKYVGLQKIHYDNDNWRYANNGRHSSTYAGFLLIPHSLSFLMLSFFVSAQRAGSQRRTMGPRPHKYYLNV